MIDFLTENVEMPELDFRLIGKWVEAVAMTHSRMCANICYCFCDDDYILKTNREFLQHDYFTDVITFDYSRGDKIGGDILISLDTVRSNAEQMGVVYMQELHRVIIHGVLHLCGIDDKAPGARAGMERAENAALELLNTLKN